MCFRKSLSVCHCQCSEIESSHPQLLAFLLKSKSCLTSSRIFQLVLYLCSSVNLSSGSTYIQNPAAFRALLCDLEVNAHTSVVQLQQVNNFPRPPGRHQRLLMISLFFSPDTLSWCLSGLAEHVR